MLPALTCSGAAPLVRAAGCAPARLALPAALGPLVQWRSVHPSHARRARAGVAVSAAVQRASNAANAGDADAGRDFGSSLALMVLGVSWA